MNPSSEAQATAHRSTEDEAAAFFRDRDHVATYLAGFITRHSHPTGSGGKGPVGVVCVTSGATTVPLQ